ncbi:MAG: hypothetical protein M1821_004808 [Bathelium mastoideum]|nr:MAG: hypothetical protein M1821_004808 [Bathelium mastoideum]
MLTRVPLIALSLASSAAAQTSSVTSIFFGGLAGIDQGDPNTLFATVVASVVAVQPTATVFAINCRSSNTPNSNISGRSSNDDDEGESDEGSDDEGENYYGNADDDDDDNGEDGENGDDGEDDDDDNDDDDPCAGPPIIITANPTLFVLQSTITAPGTTDAETTAAPGTLTMSSRCELTGTTAGECSYFVGGANATAMGVDATDIMTAPVVQPLLTTEITFTPVTITAGLEKLSAGASSAGASGSSGVTATATSNGTGAATGKPTASKSGTATGAAQSGNGAAGVRAGLAVFVPLAAVLGWLLA